MASEHELLFKRAMEISKHLPQIITGVQLEKGKRFFAIHPSLLTPSRCLFKEERNFGRSFHVEESGIKIWDVIMSYGPLVRKTKELFAQSIEEEANMTRLETMRKIQVENTDAEIKEKTQELKILREAHKDPLKRSMLKTDILVLTAKKEHLDVTCWPTLISAERITRFRLLRRLAFFEEVRRLVHEMGHTDLMNM